jgi:predicted Fe-Mo cluster-binding NifX family protein
MPLVGLALPAALVSLVVTVGFGMLQMRRGRRLHSPALKADARDYLTDGLSTALVIGGLVAAWLGFNLDRWAAAAVSCFVFWSGGQLLWRALCDLMDQAIDRDTERALISTAEQDPLVEGVERVLSRTAGGRFLVEMDVLPRTSSLEKAELLSKNLERNLLRKFPQLVSVRVRARSGPKDHIRRFTPVKSPDGALEKHLARAPWFRLQEIDRASGQILSEEYLENPHASAETKRGFLVGRWLLDLKPDQVVVAERKEGTAAALLEEAGVELVTSDKSGD